MNSILLHQKANELVKVAGSRDIRNITKELGMNLSETTFDNILGLFSFQWDFYSIFINNRLDKFTKQMVCGYALSRYADAYILRPNESFKKMDVITTSHLSEYESNAFSSHLMLDSDEVYHLTTLGYDAQQIADRTKRHLHLILVKLLEMHHMGFDLAHYQEQHRTFFENHQHLAHLAFD